MRSFDPVRLTLVGTGIERAAAVMDTLLYRNEITDEVEPKLARSIETPDNGTTWVLGLREGVTFTDGEPLNAQAVIFNINRHTAPDSTSIAKTMLEGVRSVEATGEYEVTFTLAAPDAFFPLTLTAASPAGLIGSPKALADPATFAENPVGAGPFEVANWVRDDRLELVKNDDYWNEGKPYLDGVTYILQPDNKTRTDSLLSGEIDIAQINAEFLGQFGDGRHQVWTELPAGGTLVIPNNESGPGSDLRVRQAIRMAFDPKVTQQLLFPNSTAWDGDLSCVPFPTSSPACNPEAAASYDLDGARELIADYLADGGTPDVEMVYFQLLTTMATYVQQQFKAIGLNLRLEGLDTAGLAEVSNTGAYQFMLTQTAGTGYPTVWTRFYSKSANNWPRMARPELDAQLLGVRGAVDPDVAADEWHTFSDMVADEAIVTWFAPYTSHSVTASHVRIGSDEQPYKGSTMVYLDSAWLDE